LIRHCIRMSATQDVAEATEQLQKVEVNSAGDGEDEDDIVNPWSVASKSSKGVDYDKLIG
jgi:hypothetical protein